MMDEEAVAASAINEMGWRACRQEPISNGCNSKPSKRRLTPGRTTSLMSVSPGSAFIVAASSIGLMAASYTGSKAYDLQDNTEWQSIKQQNQNDGINYPKKYKKAGQS